MVRCECRGWPCLEQVASPSPRLPVVPDLGLLGRRLGPGDPLLRERGGRGLGIHLCLLVIPLLRLGRPGLGKLLAFHRLGCLLDLALVLIPGLDQRLDLSVS